MHLIQNYALNAGVKIGRPQIYEKYFPIPFEKYIVLQGSSKQSKTYDLWDDVLSIIAQTLNDNNIGVIQIGSKGDRVFPGCVNLTGQTNLNQAAYIIKNSLLVVGVDSFALHFASHYDKKIVGLYSNNNINNVRPYWGNREHQILLEPERNGRKPSYSLKEEPKTINFIKPEDVGGAILKLLGLKFDFPFKSIFLGRDYLSRIIEIVPNCVVDPRSVGVERMIIRADFEYNEENIAKQLSFGPCTIITDKPLRRELIGAYRQHVAEIIYVISENDNPEFAELLYTGALNYKLVSYLDTDTLNKKKGNYMDYGLIFQNKVDVPEEIKNKKPLFYKTAKYTLSNGKIYPCRAAMLEDKPAPNFGYSIYHLDFQNPNEFWKELGHFCILTK